MSQKGTIFTLPTNLSVLTLLSLPNEAKTFLLSLPREATVIISQDSKEKMLFWPDRLWSLLDIVRKKKNPSTVDDLVELLISSGETYVQVQLPPEKETLLTRRVKWLTKEYLLIRKLRPFMSAGRVAFLQSLIKSSLRLNWRQWRWEWRWLWLQRSLLNLVDSYRLATPGLSPKRWLANELARKLVEEEMKKALEQRKVTNIFDVKEEYRRWYDGSIPDLISIVLPVYNQVDFLKEAIDSIVNQTYQYWELIVVNDGSEENLEPVLELYRTDERIKIYNRPHRGLPATLTFGFKQAQGEFYTWTSADNVLLLDNLQKHVAFLHDNPAVHFVYSNYELIDERSEPLRPSYEPIENISFFSPNKIQISSDLRQLNYTNNFIGPSFMYRSIMGKIIGDYDGKMTVEDYDFFMRFNSLLHLSHIDNDESLYRYRYHQQSLTGQNRPSGFVFQQRESLVAWERKVRQQIYHSPFKLWIINFNRQFRHWTGPRPKIDHLATHLIVLKDGMFHRNRFQRWLLDKWRQYYNVVVIFWLESGANKWSGIEESAQWADWVLTNDRQLLADNRLSVPNLILSPEIDWDSPLIKVLTYSTVVNKARRYGIE